MPQLKTLSSLLKRIKSESYSLASGGDVKYARAETLREAKISPAAKCPSWSCYLFLVRLIFFSYHAVTFDEVTNLRNISRANVWVHLCSFHQKMIKETLWNKYYEKSLYIIRYKIYTLINIESSFFRDNPVLLLERGVGGGQEPWGGLRVGVGVKVPLRY